jgi:hypothetical protein
MAERVVIRSYRRVFQVDRRIYRVDRWALPVPGGVPLRAVGYFAATVLLAAVLPLGILSPPLRYVVVPLAVAVLGTQAAPDGRTAHRFAWDWLRFRLRAHRRHRACVRGPARVTFNVATTLGDPPSHVVLAGDCVLELRP